MTDNIYNVNISTIYSINGCSASGEIGNYRSKGSIKTLIISLHRDLLEIRENDQTDDQGHDRQTMTHHGQVVETDGELQGQTQH